MGNIRKKSVMNEKDKIIGVKIPLLCIVVSTLLTHFFTLKEIDYEKTLQIIENNESEEELLMEAQRYFLLEEYAEVIHIYNQDKMENNPTALSNLGYMYENGIVYGKDIEKAREYYEKSAALGNSNCMENYILFTIKYPKSYDNLLGVLQNGFEHNSNTVYEFIKSYFSDVNATREDVKKFLDLDTDSKIEILQYQVDYRLKEETEEIADEMICEKMYYEAQEKVKYKNLEYNLDCGDQVGIYKNIVPVYLNVPVGEIRNYYINFMFSNDNETQFVFYEE